MKRDSSPRTANKGKANVTAGLTLSGAGSVHGDRPSSPDELEEIIRRQVSRVSTANAGAHEVWIPLFLAALERTPNWSLAARVAGVNPSTPHKRAGVDPEFAAAAAVAERSALDLIEAAAFKSAVYGDLEPVFHEGVKVGEVVRYSDRMRELLLKAYRPDRFRERVAAQSGSRAKRLVGGPLLPCRQVTAVQAAAGKPRAIWRTSRGSGPKGPGSAGRPTLGRELLGFKDGCLLPAGRRPGHAHRVGQVAGSQGRAPLEAAPIRLVG